MSASPKRQVPRPNATRATSYARFIPREELGPFAAWSPETLSDETTTPQQQMSDLPPEKHGSAEQDDARQVLAARQSGYKDGYSDGLVALESFKCSYAGQITAQLGTLTDAYAGQLDQLHEQLAQALATTATSLARQVVRSELSTRPELIADVAKQAIDTLMASAKHITLRIHPEDHALVAQGTSDHIDAKGVRLITDTGVTRGGCFVESDIGVIDATLDVRWQCAAAALGCTSAWPSEPHPESGDEPGSDTWTYCFHEVN